MPQLHKHFSEVCYQLICLRYYQKLPTQGELATLLDQVPNTPGGSNLFFNETDLMTTLPVLKVTNSGRMGNFHYRLLFFIFICSYSYYMKKIIITIDGFSSCGKSTLAKQLAKELNYVYIDSGAMYRAITLYFLRNHIDWTEKAEVVEALDNIHLEFIFNPQSFQSEMHLNGENVEYVIRDLLIAEKVSEISSIKEVREFAVAAQRKMGEGKGIVMDGRDIGTTVFPDAELKIFMTADSVVRIERRFREMYAKNPNVSIDEVKNNLQMRDFIDSNREISPLRKAADAIELDNTDLTEEQQLQFALGEASRLKLSRD